MSGPQAAGEGTGSPRPQENVQGGFVRYSGLSCAECQAPIPAGTRGKPRRFCEPRCKARWWHRRHAKRPGVGRLLAAWLLWQESDAVL